MKYHNIAQHPSPQEERQGKEHENMEKIVGAFEARRNLGTLIAEAYYRKESFIIKNHGRPMAAIIPIEDYERLQQLAKDQVFVFLQSVWEKNKDVPAAKLEQDVKRALTMLHKERNGQRRARARKKQ
jgi:prevent-host-death family protein